MRALGEGELPIAMFEIELEEGGCFSQISKHGVRVRHQPNMLLGLGIDREEVEGEAESYRAILRNDEWGTSPFQRMVWFR